MKEVDVGEERLLEIIAGIGARGQLNWELIKDEIDLMLGKRF